MFLNAALALGGPRQTLVKTVENNRGNVKYPWLGI